MNPARLGVRWTDCRLGSKASVIGLSPAGAATDGGRGNVRAGRINTVRPPRVSRVRLASSGTSTVCAQFIGYLCTACDHQWSDDATSCPACGRATVRRLFGNNVGGEIKPTGTLEGVADNPRPGQEFIQYLSPSGSRSDSALGADRLELTMRSPIDIGRNGESVVVGRVIAQLRADGRQVTLLPHRDERGEDGVILCDGKRVTVQVVGVPADHTFLAEASRGSASTTVPIDRAVFWIHEALKSKEAQYPLGDRAEMLLAIDVRAVGVLTSPTVTESVGVRYGDVCKDSGFGAVWLVGPSETRCTRLGSSRW